MRLLVLMALLVFSPSLFADPDFRLQPGKASDWQPNTPAGNTLQVSVVPGNEGEAVRLDYSFKPGEWVEAMRDFSLKSGSRGNLVFWWRGSRTGVVFELKFLDSDDTVFGLKYPTRDLREDQWTKVVIPWKDLHVMWGGNMKLDPITRIGFALSGVGGKGTFEISDFHSEPADSSWSLDLQVNQVGYHPMSRKEFVGRLLDLPAATPPPAELPFRIVDTKGVSAFQGKARLVDFKDWPGNYYVGDFSDLREEGQFRVELDFSADGKQRMVRSPTFKIGPRVLSEGTARLEFDFLKAMQCGTRCHTVTPLKGGYHDTRFDISQRTWAIPSLVIGVKEYAQNADFRWDDNDNRIEDALEELAFGAEFCAKFPEPDGTVSWGGIESDFKKAGMNIGQWLAMISPLKAEDDKFERLKFKDKNFAATCFNLVAVAEALPLIKKDYPELEAPIRRTLERSWGWINTQRLRDARDYGCFLDAATACYETTGDRKYLERVTDIVPKLLALQALDYSAFERSACGDFFTSSTAKNFLWHYKTTSFNIAIHRSLLRLAKILPPSDPLFPRIRYANQVFHETYLKAMASKTPYRQLADNLEYTGDGKYRIFYFSGKNARQAAADDHGLNCDHFALGWCALKWAQLTGDLELQQLAEDQIHWALGRNPFGFSMLIGAGEKNPVIVADFWNKTLKGTIINGPASLDGQSITYKPEHFGHSEEWLPHNGDYLRLLGSLESDARLDGVVLEKGNPVEGADVRVLQGSKVVYRGKTGQDGRWSAPPLPYGRRYMVRITRGFLGGLFGEQAQYEMNLAAGTRQTLRTHLDRFFDVAIEKEALKKGEASNIKVRITNRSSGEITPSLKAYVRGAELQYSPGQMPRIDEDDSAQLEYQVVPNGKEPFYFLIYDTEDPQATASVYELI